MAGQVAQVGEIFKPKTAKDLETFRDKLEMFNHTFTQYKENLKYGVAAGMVRSNEECDAGYKSFSRSLPSGGERRRKRLGGRETKNTNKQTYSVIVFSIRPNTRKYVEIEIKSSKFLKCSIANLIGLARMLAHTI